MIKQIIIIACIIFSINSAYSNILINNGLSHLFKTDKGKVYKGNIELKNAGKTVQSVQLYLQDVSYNAAGNTFYTTPGTNTFSNTSWLKFSTNLVELQPEETKSVTFEIHVPDSVSKAGSYSSILMVEPISEIVPNKKKEGIQINSIIRYAIQIVTDYDIKNATTELKFESINLDTTNNQKQLLIALQNQGSVYCRTTIVLEIYNNQDGKKIEDSFVSQKMGLLPNTSRSFPINISLLPNGKYKIVAFAKDEEDNVFALEFELDV